MVSNYPIKIVFFDIDDTLYHKAEKKIPDSVLNLLPQLKKNGIIPAIATGRCYSAFPDAVRPLIENKLIELLVTINGQYNIFQEKIISHYPLAQSRIATLLHKLDQLNIAYAFVANENIAVSCDNEQIREALSPIKIDYIVDPAYYRTHTIYQLLAFYEENQIDAQAKQILLGEDLKAVRWHSFSVDILNKHHSKAKGIDDVLSYFNLTPNHAMAFGDGLNDIEMLSHVGIGVAMGNAVTELKAVADYVTLPITEAGIEAALTHFKLI